MWIALALLSAVGGAGTSLVLKRAVGHSGAVVSAVAIRLIGGVLLAAVVSALGGWPHPTPAYWRAVALILAPEVAGMACMTLALRAGDLSLVQPLMGLLPPFVMLAGVVFLGEVPTVPAAVGVLLVTAGVYCVGLERGRSALEPLRALVRSQASWYAVAAALFWSVTTIVHKFGIAEVGPLPWAVTLAMSSGLTLGLALPLIARRTGTIGIPPAAGRWAALVALGGTTFAVQQIGLHLALRAAQAGYVVALSATSILLATVLGVVLLGERSAAGARIAGGVLVSAGAALIGAFG